MVELFQTAVHFNQLVNQRTTGDFGRVRSQHQLQRQRLNGRQNVGFADIFLLLQGIKGLFQQLRMVLTFAALRDGLILLSYVGEVQKLTECACNRQKLLVGEVLQRIEQLFTMSIIACTG